MGLLSGRRISSKTKTRLPQIEQDDGGLPWCSGAANESWHSILTSVWLVWQFSLLVQAHKLTKLDGNGDAELDSYLAMPGNTSTGTLWNPPDTEDGEFPVLPAPIARPWLHKRHRAGARAVRVSWHSSC